MNILCSSLISHKQTHHSLPFTHRITFPNTFFSLIVSNASFALSSEYASYRWGCNAPVSTISHNDSTHYASLATFSPTPCTTAGLFFRYPPK